MASVHNKEEKVSTKKLFKISGESLGENQKGFHIDRVDFLVKEISDAFHKNRKLGLALVIGGGNIMRGAEIVHVLSQPSADHIGMLSTVMNGVLIKTKLEEAGVGAVHMCKLNLHVPELIAPFDVAEAKRALEAGKVLILSGGTGKPGVTTDSGAVMLAAEIGATLVLKGTKVDGIFTADPNTHPEAVFLHRLSHDEFGVRGLKKIFDPGAVTKAGESGIAIQIFNFFTPGNISRAIQGEEIGSVIRTDAE
jgi:uridylate kinase